MKKLVVASLAFALCASSAQAQNHIYQLDNSLADQLGGPSLVADGGALGALGYTFGPNQGLTLSSVFSSGSSYTLALRSMYTAAGDYSWRKVVDFKDLTSDLGYYDKDGISYFVGAGTGGTPFVNNVMSFLVLTRDASTKTVSVYVNGAQSLTFYDGSDLADFSGAGGVAHFFEDDVNFSRREAAPGYVDYIATYDRALSASEVAGLDAVPVTTPEPASLVLMATGFAGLAGIVRRRRRWALRD